MTVMSASDRPRRILIAEDDPSIASLLTMQLQMEGYEVIRTANGAIAWEVLQQPELPELVILDVLMPKMDGFEVCRRIRSTPRMETLPVVFLTALQDTASRLEGLEAGANDFLGKPWSKAELYARLRTLLRLKDVQDALQRQSRRMGLLYDISRELSAYLDIDGMLSLMLARTAHVVEASEGGVVLFGEKGVRRKIEMDQSLETRVVTPPKLNPLEQSVASWMFKNRRPLLVANTADRTGFEGSTEVGSLVATPFMHQLDLRGFLVLMHSTPDWFDNDHLELVSSITRQATITMENANLFERVEQERQRFAALIASMDDAVIATGKEQEIILVNPAGAQLLQRQERDLIGETVTDVIPDETLRSLFTGVARDICSLTSEIGWDNYRTIYATVSPVGDGGQVAVIQDITQLKTLQSMQLAAEQEKTARVRSTFERYMSPELVDRALSEERGLMEKRERRRAAVLFADLRGFTRLTMRFSPDDVTAILNEFFTVMTSAAYAYNGTIFDIAGDELMVAFGVPFTLPDPMTAAVQAAIEMQTVFTNLSEKWWRTYGDKRVGMGIGIDFGEVIVGNVGSPTRMNYALVGLPVTTSHALVSTAADGEIRFSQAVMKELDTCDLSFPVSVVKAVHLKGRDNPETVYSMLVERHGRLGPEGHADCHSGSSA